MTPWPPLQDGEGEVLRLMNEFGGFVMLVLPDEVIAEAIKDCQTDSERIDTFAELVRTSGMGKCTHLEWHYMSGYIMPACKPQNKERLAYIEDIKTSWGGESAQMRVHSHLPNGEIIFLIFRPESPMWAQCYCKSFE